MAIHVELATELEAGAARKILSVEIFGTSEETVRKIPQPKHLLTF